MALPYQLNTAENQLIARAKVGEELDLAGISDAEGKKIRASDIYELAIESDSNARPVHAKGIMLRGAIIQGSLDLTAAKVLKPIELANCTFEEKIVLRYAKTSSLKFDGSFVRGIDAEGLRVDGSLYLSNGFISKGEVGLRGVDIKGDLDAKGGRFINPGGNAIDADGLATEDDVLFCLSDEVHENEIFSAVGAVRIEGSRIGGSLICNGGVFENDTGGALIAVLGLNTISDSTKAIARRYRMLGPETSDHGDPCRPGVPASSRRTPPTERVRGFPAAPRSP